MDIKRLSKAVDGKTEKNGGLNIEFMLSYAINNNLITKKIKRKELEEIIKEYLITKDLYEESKNKYNCTIHQESIKENKNYKVIVSIDPGSVNFCIRIEKRKKGVVKTVVYETIDFKNENETDSIYHNITKYLNLYIDFFKKTDIILIEKQIFNLKTKMINYKMIRVSQHVISYFIFISTNWIKKPRIVEVDSGLKTKGLGATIKMNKPARKKWCIKKAMEILEERGDFENLEKLKKSRKKDDLGDVLCQAEAYFINFCLEK